MPEYDGPWGGQKPSPPPARRRIPIGLVLWVALILVAAAAFWVLTQLFPGQLTGMSEGQALYGLGLLALVSSGLVFARRIKVGRTLRHLAIWVCIGAVVVIGYSFRDDFMALALKVRGELIPAYAVATSPHALVVNRSDDGGFYVMGQVNGAPVRFLMDTGATETVLSPADARRLGVDLASLDFTKAHETANGVGYGASFLAKSLTVGPIRLADFPVSINQAPMSASLLGMTFFRRLDTFQIRGDQLFLTWRG